MINTVGPDFVIRKRGVVRMRSSVSEKVPGALWRYGEERDISNDPLGGLRRATKFERKSGFWHLFNHGMKRK